VLARLREQDPLLVEEPNEVLPRHVKEVGGLLGGQLFADRHDGDRVAARHHLGDALEHAEHRLGDGERLALGTHELALRGAPLRRVSHGAHRSEESLDLRALLGRRGIGG
jgi:hypothetical protein